VADTDAVEAATGAGVVGVEVGIEAGIEVEVEIGVEV
jgi:hypothetical protein